MSVFNDTPVYFWVALAIPLVTAVLTPLLLYFAVKSWRDRYWSLAGRIHYSAVSLGALLFI